MREAALTVGNDFGAVNTLGELARFHARVRPDAVALAFEERVTTYAEFELLSRRVANGLLQERLRAGDRVGFLGKNSDLLFQILFGCAGSGTVFVGLNWRLSPDELVYLINDSGIQVLFAGAEFCEAVQALRGRTPALRVIVVMEAGHPQWQAFTTWRDRQSDADPQVAVDAEDIVVQMYTSGTTGGAKGVELPHRAFFAMQRQPGYEDVECERWSDRDVSLLAMPGFHIGGVGWGIIGLRAGACTVVIREFDAAVVLDAIQRHRVTRLFLVPTAMRMVLQHPRARETSFESLSYITYAASPIPLDLLREALATFRCGFVQLYGMTETTGGATYLPPEDHDVAGNERMRSAGKPFPGVRIKVIDAEGRSLPRRSMGEICIASPTNMRGYAHQAEATARTLVDGYVHTGDAGFLDEDGYVYVLDRAKDMIVSGAENIYPAEIETVVSSHPDVAECAVIGVPDERWGEAVKAVVVLRAGRSLSAEVLLEFVRERIARYKVPKSVDFIDQLPRNAAGKVLKRALRAPYWAGRERAV